MLIAHVLKSVCLRSPDYSICAVLGQGPRQSVSAAEQFSQNTKGAKSVKHNEAKLTKEKQGQMDLQLHIKNGKPQIIHRSDTNLHTSAQ